MQHIGITQLVWSFCKDHTYNEAKKNQDLVDFYYNQGGEYMNININEYMNISICVIIALLILNFFIEPIAEVVSDFLYRHS